ncbi:14287_t:CDS:2 [Gigaspora margarita]|uniref:14287_t:CDS:1 n=1 Tax=Gigaspora margarita TaxID=4874 RepID=A0ABM8VYK3_GIGMA|nr:14287_t:CDS:2 [Gigaspora margarita]
MDIQNEIRILGMLKTNFGNHIQEIASLSKFRIMFEPNCLSILTLNPQL